MSNELEQVTRERDEARAATALALDALVEAKRERDEAWAAIVRDTPLSATPLADALKAMEHRAQVAEDNAYAEGQERQSLADVLKQCVEALEGLRYANSNCWCSASWVAMNRGDSPGCVAARAALDAARKLLK